MPGQGQELIQIAQLRSQVREEQQLQLSISNEMVQSLKQVYDIYVKQNMPLLIKFDFFHYCLVHGNMKK